MEPWWLPKHEVCTVNLPATSAVLQNSSVPNHRTPLKLGAVVRHVLQQHGKETVKDPKTWVQQISFFFYFFLFFSVQLHLAAGALIIG